MHTDWVVRVILGGRIMRKINSRVRHSLSGRCLFPDVDLTSEWVAETACGVDWFAAVCCGLVCFAGCWGGVPNRSVWWAGVGRATKCSWKRGLWVAAQIGGHTQGLKENAYYPVHIV